MNLEKCFLILLRNKNLGLNFFPFRTQTMNLGWGVVSFLLIVALMTLGKGFFAGTKIARRPNGSGNDGFPSGHAAIATGIATIALLMGVSWKIVLLLILVAAIVSWQRIASGAHSETQVIAGNVLGVAVPVAIAFATRSF